MQWDRGRNLTTNQHFKIVKNGEYHSKRLGRGGGANHSTNKRKALKVIVTLHSESRAVIRSNDTGYYTDLEISTTTPQEIAERCKRYSYRPDLSSRKNILAKVNDVIRKRILEVYQDREITVKYISANE